MLEKMRNEIVVVLVGSAVMPLFEPSLILLRKDENEFIVKLSNELKN